MTCIYSIQQKILEFEECWWEDELITGDLKLSDHFVKYSLQGVTRQQSRLSGVSYKMFILQVSEPFQRTNYRIMAQIPTVAADIMDRKLLQYQTLIGELC